MAAEADAMHSGKAADLNTNAGILYGQANDLVDIAPVGSEAGREANLAAGGAAGAQMGYEMMNEGAFSLYRLMDRANKSCDPPLLGDIKDLAEIALGQVQYRCQRMEDDTQEGFEYMASAQGKL